jgi:hypothetical protein
MIKYFLCFLLIIFILQVRAQDTSDEAISSDRPGIATPPSILGPGRVEIETGFSAEKISGPDFYQETILYNTTVLRFGINKNFEIRLQDDFARVKTDSLVITGLNPVTIGTKLLISQGKGAVPEVSFMVNLALPYVGDKRFRPEHPTPSFYLLMQNDLSKKFSLCYNFGLEYQSSTLEPDEFVAINLNYEISEKFNCFAENYNWFSDSASPRFFADAGFVWIPLHNLQVDISGGIRLTGIDKYWMMACGLSWRIPK